MEWNCNASFAVKAYCALIRGSSGPPKVIAMRRSITALVTGGLLLFGSLGFAGGVAAATLAPTTTCSNGVDNTGGLGLICRVTVNNTITASGGSATVTVRECHGAAGDPRASCTFETATLSSPVTAVTQCNDSINGGGGTLRCSVEVTNTFDGVSPGSTGVTVNQCVGSAGGGGIGIVCDPFPATTTGATITQCNGSANGGGVVATSTCTASGTTASALGVTINQCNGSANGGGALIICSASITNVVQAATPPPSAGATTTPSAGTTPAPSAGTTASPTSAPTTAPTPPATDMLTATDQAGPGSGFGPAALLIVTIMLGAVVVGRVVRRGIGSTRTD